MTVCGKPGKTIKLFSHPSHKPWKSLRDSHIPSALRLIISIQFSNQKRSLPQLPIPLTFRLILQLEKTERKQIFLVTQARRLPGDLWRSLEGIAETDGAPLHQRRV
jgi:hypothetical protein